MTKTVTSPYDVAEHLCTPEEMAAYLEASIEEADGDAAFIAKALGDIARAKGMSQVACDAGVLRVRDRFDLLRPEISASSVTERSPRAA